MNADIKLIRIYGGSMLSRATKSQLWFQRNGVTTVIRLNSKQANILAAVMGVPKEEQTKNEWEEVINTRLTYE